MTMVACSRVGVHRLFTSGALWVLFLLRKEGCLALAFPSQGEGAPRGTPSPLPCSVHLVGRIAGVCTQAERTLGAGVRARAGPGGKGWGRCGSTRPSAWPDGAEGGDELLTDELSPISVAVAADARVAVRASHHAGWWVAHAIGWLLEGAMGRANGAESSGQASSTHQHRG
jgi:hypothetical protein